MRFRIALYCLAFAVALTAVWVNVALAESGTTATGTSRAMNPAISLNGLFLGEWRDRTEEGEKNAGLSLQEMELTLTSIVDPYFKAKAHIVIGPAEAHDHKSEEPHGDQIALEEIYARAMALPAGLGARAGRILIPFGRTNQIHLHQLPFIDAQRGFSDLVGPHGMPDVGVELSYSPDVPWYLNLIAFAGDGGTELFAAEDEALAFAGRIENFWDLSDATTFELGGSTMTGPTDQIQDHVFVGGDVRLKWRDPRKTHGKAIEWMTELIVDDAPEIDSRTGILSHLRARVARNWWIGAGYSSVSESLTTREIKAQIAFVPSEFSALRCDASYLDPPGDADPVLELQLQLNVTIGSHPAHLY